MLEISQLPIGQAVTETGKLLAAHKLKIDPTVLRFTSAGALRDFLNSNTVPTRPNRLALLGDPALTGMSRTELAVLIERLSLRQAAQIWVRPLLEETGYAVTRSATRYSSADALLNAIVRSVA
ncbi:hypothetical protein AB0L76_08990 [Nonomuraea fuscirosea]